jgi:hypothetical protein
MMQQMTSRERNLATFVAVLVIGLVGVMLTKKFTQNYRQLTDQLRSKTFQLSSMKTLITERELWEQRDQLLAAKQPILGNRTSAGNDFLEELKTIASEHSVMIEEPGFGLVQSNKPHYQSVSVQFTAKGSGPDLTNFMKAAQTPDKFVVFTSATIEVAKNEETKMQGKFNAERWFAPK